MSVILRDAQRRWFVVQYFGKFNKLTGEAPMWSRYPTDDELRRIFEETLTAVVAGAGPTSCSWFDMWTDTTLSEIMEAYPDVTDALIAQARAAFAGQLDGSNSRAYEAAMDAAFQQQRPEAAIEVYKALHSPKRTDG
ncbi:hypothetical protein [Streptomyces sp. CB00072]|uniref:hypothetical protein n=2 Tax=Streptomyces TaxID=1883 RepID=UPI00093F74A3|nr:hypothetical protein [Streptomyces sp. CB00072]